MDIAIAGIKLKYSPEKKHGCGTNYFFQGLDESPLKAIIELGKDIKMQIWEYNGKFYLKSDEKKHCDYSTGLMNESDGSEITHPRLHKLRLRKMFHTLWISHLQSMVLKRIKNILKDIHFLKSIGIVINTNI